MPLVFARTTLDKIVDALIARILSYTDYYILKKHVTLSETALFAFSTSWTLWFIFKGVYVSEMPMGRAMWVTLFGMSSLLHFMAFFLKDLLGRALVCVFYAFLFCFLTLLSLYTGSIAPAVPTLAVFTMLAVFIAVRMFRERRV